MSTPSVIRAAIKTILNANVSGLTVYPLVPEGNANLPACVVLPASANFISMARGVDEWVYDLMVLVSRSDDTLAQTALDALVAGSGAGSIRTALFNNPTLGLSDTHVVVTAVDNYGGTYDAAGFPHVGATLRLMVRTTGTA